MSVACIQTKDSEELEQFFIKTSDRIKYQMFLANPKVELFKQGEYTYIIFQAKNKFQFPLFEIGVLGVIAILLVWGLHWSVIVPMIPLIAGTFEKPYFVGWLLKRGLKKEGHTLPVKVVHPDELNEVLLAHG